MRPLLAFALALALTVMPAREILDVEEVAVTRQGETIRSRAIVESGT